MEGAPGCQLGFLDVWIKDIYIVVETQTVYHEEVTPKQGNGSESGKERLDALWPWVLGAALFSGCLPYPTVVYSACSAPYL